MQNIGVLRSFDGCDLCDFDVQDVPGLLDRPPLHDVTIEGLRADKAGVLRKRFRNLPHLAPGKARSAAWLSKISTLRSATGTPTARHSARQP
ncbi:MAG TPA: hypothetical protein VGC55_14090 [Dokdonella sp.]